MITFFQTYGQTIGFAVITGSLILLFIYMVVAHPKIKSCCRVDEKKYNSDDWFVKVPENFVGTLTDMSLTTERLSAEDKKLSEDSADPRLALRTTQHITLPIYNLSCGGGGSLTIERILTHTLGVIDVYVNPLTEMAYIGYEPLQITPEQITGVIERAGFGPRKANTLRSHS